MKIVKQGTKNHWFHYVYHFLGKLIKKENKIND